jgi:hypothetical protein
MKQEIDFELLISLSSNLFSGLDLGSRFDLNEGWVKGAFC